MGIIFCYLDGDNDKGSEIHMNNAFYFEIRALLF